MEFISTGIRDLWIINPRVFEDARGYFFESFNENVFAEKIGQNVHFVQDNESCSSAGVVRGLHLQVPPFAQGKLVRVIKGSVIDVAVDIRAGSPTYGKHVAVELNEKNHTMMWIPAGFAHGFSVLEDNTIFAYKCSGFYNRESERSVLYNDASLGIDWKVKNPIVSDKDKTGTPFKDFKTPFTYIQ